MAGQTSLAYRKINDEALCFLYLKEALAAEAKKWGAPALLYQHPQRPDPTVVCASLMLLAEVIE
jgi:hypothetical protein